MLARVLSLHLFFFYARRRVGDEMKHADGIGYTGRVRRERCTLRRNALFSPLIGQRIYFILYLSVFPEEPGLFGKKKGGEYRGRGRE